MSAGRVKTAAIVGAAALAALLVFAPLAGGGIDLAAALKEPPWAPEFACTDALIFWGTRVPRVLAGAIAGAALALCGVAFQAVLRNPLAEPYVLGVSAGAAMGKAVAVLALPLSLATSAGINLLACFAGALLPMLLLVALTRRSGRFSPVRLILAGTVLNIVLSAAMMLISSLTSPERARQMQLWWLGTLDVTSWWQLGVAAAVSAVMIVLLLKRSGAMNLLSLDALSAHSMGLHVRRETLVVLVATTLLISSIVAVVGPIGFVGLVVPHALRFLLGSDNRIVAPLAVIYGAVFLVGCDLVGWRLPSVLGWGDEGELQISVGIITALAGGPAFLYLLFATGGAPEAD